MIFKKPSEEEKEQSRKNKEIEKELSKAKEASANELKVRLIYQFTHRYCC